MGRAVCVCMCVCVYVCACVCVCVCVCGAHTHGNGAQCSLGCATLFNFPAQNLLNTYIMWSGPTKGTPNLRSIVETLIPTQLWSEKAVNPYNHPSACIMSFQYDLLLAQAEVILWAHCTFHRSPPTLTLISGVMLT